MESPQDDSVVVAGDDNQTLSSGEFNFNEHNYVVGDTELAGISERYIETRNEADLHNFSFITSDTSMGIPPRKVHSATPSSSGFGSHNTYEEMPRPYTSAGIDAPPSSASRLVRQSKKKHSAVRKQMARDSEMSPEERPRSADVNGWGDFDTDRLLRDESAFPHDRSNQGSLDTLDKQRSKSRKSRRSTPATSSPRPNPWEGYLHLYNDTKESSRPAVQVLRQKTIEILNLDLVAQTNQPTARASTTPKPLLGRASLERLISSRSRPATSYISRPTTPTLLFGSEIPDTPNNRTFIFKRFDELWSLISHRSPISPYEEPSESETALNFSAQTRSPFECSMTMVKICKVVGISLTPSAATHLSFWYTNEYGVDFESFCDLVVQGAIQPALRHFNLDNTIDEYVAAIDTIVQSIVTSAPARRRKDKPAPLDCPRRLKELNEIQPVFMSWKAGISPRLVQPAEDPAPTPTRALVTAERVRRALEASASQRMLAHQFPSEEARVTHVENIRRKVQLHKSWKFTSDGKIVDRGISSPNTQLVSRGSEASSRNEWSTVSISNAGLSEMLECSHSVLPTSAGVGFVENVLEEGDRPELPAATDRKDTISDKCKDGQNDEVLVCCSCSVRSAVLWCSSCFTVNCQKCWQEIHSCTVDMSIVSSAAAKKPLLGPTALAMKKKRCGSATLRPPVAMIYLPTKAIIPGALARGNPIVRHRRKSSNQVTSKDEIPAVVANAILPKLNQSQSDISLQRRHESPQLESTPSTTDSTADLVKSLMLRMSPSTPTPGSRSTGSHTSKEGVMRMHKHHAPSRPNLHLAPVSLDPDLLLSNTPDRRR
ncbi:unnamed protein product [Phytophthora lilii]|uniref:Unnamed protein product n=1 Tax=Phytophthora lilii TaxID=2077276 RepID=A0A9W6X4X0_9STRA|nr:unnamed protein product [Phytophthora lilii]